MSSEGESTSKPTTAAGLVLEAWGQGFMVAALVIMAVITIANMRRGILLHKLIFIELLLGVPNGFFIFFDPPAYSWYLSCTAIFLNMSWSLHNLIAWMKSRPFLTRRASLFYLWSVIIVQPYWVLEIYANFAFFNNINRVFVTTRPYEALFRDPWWIFTTINLVWNIKYRYSFGFIELSRISPRFAIMLCSMCISIVFIIVDILAVTKGISLGLAEGINPFWKLAFVFKCLTDTIVLDDFKTALDKLSRYKMDQIRETSDGRSGNHTGLDRWVELGSGPVIVTQTGDRSQTGRGIRVDVETTVSRDAHAAEGMPGSPEGSTTDILHDKVGKMA